MIGLTICAWSVAIVLWGTWYAMYFKWRDCFDENGRCFVAEEAVVYTAQSGVFWGLVAGSATIASLVLSLRIK